MIVTLIIYVLSTCIVYVDAYKWVNGTNEMRSPVLLLAVVVISSFPLVNTILALNVIYCYIRDL